MDAFLGMISLFGFNFPPRGWALCAGQLMSIAQNTALFSLLGTTYGGDGVTTFALPDLQGRVPMGQGQGPGLTNRVMGERSGSESTTLGITQMPMHTHSATVTATLHGETAAADLRNPLGAMLASSASPTYALPVPADDKAMASNSIVASAVIGTAGGSQPFNNLQPYLVVNYSICTQGIFPSRN